MVGLIKRSTYAKVSSEMVNPGDIAGEHRRKRIRLKWLPCQTTGIIGSTIGLVGLVYSDWMGGQV